MGTLQELQPSASANQRRAGSAANRMRCQRPGPRPQLKRVGLTLLAPAPRPGIGRVPEAGRYFCCFLITVQELGWAGMQRLSAEGWAATPVGGGLSAIVLKPRSSSVWGLPNRRHAQRCSDARIVRKLRSRPRGRRYTPAGQHPSPKAE